MKKTPSKKPVTSKKAVAAPHATPVAKPSRTASTGISVYIYWFIILFFIAATFYILGRSHNTKTPASGTNNVEITEESLLQSSDYYNSGKAKLLAGDIENAVAELTTAVEADATNVDAFILRGEAYMQSGNYDKALADFNSALALDSQNSVAYYDRALLNTRLENYSDALADINNAMAARTESPNGILQMRDLYARRGQLNLWMKNWDGAIADYTNSLALPDGVVSPTVYAERAEAYTAIGNYAAAIADYTTAVRVISEQIQGASSAAMRESLSSNAMTYFEKSAALNLNLGDAAAARDDLTSAYTIATALNDTDTMERLNGLIAELDNNTGNTKIASGVQGLDSNTTIGSGMPVSNMNTTVTETVQETSVTAPATSN